MEIFQVGGSVRDELMGVQPKDRDWVVVNSSPEEMEKDGFKPIGKDFPVFLHPETSEEYALARTEKKSGVGYKGFEFYFDSSVTLEEDLKRRDFTINSIAKDKNGNIMEAEIPLLMFPCKVSEGDMFYIVHIDDVTEIRCGEPPL